MSYELLMLDHGSILHTHQFTWRLDKNISESRLLMLLLLNVCLDVYLYSCKQRSMSVNRPSNCVRGSPRTHWPGGENVPKFSLLSRYCLMFIKYFRRVDTSMPALSTAAYHSRISLHQLASSMSPFVIISFFTVFCYFTHASFLTPSWFNPEEHTFAWLLTKIWYWIWCSPLREGWAYHWEMTMHECSPDESFGKIIWVSGWNSLFLFH